MLSLVPLREQPSESEFSCLYIYPFMSYYFILAPHLSRLTYFCVMFMIKLNCKGSEI